MIRLVGLAYVSPRGGDFGKVIFFLFLLETRLHSVVLAGLGLTVCLSLPAVPSSPLAPAF